MVSKSMMELVEAYREQERLHSTEGMHGVRNLCKLVKAIGYADNSYLGQFNGGCVGDLIEFLKDNPGAIECIIEWICETELSYWAENIEEQIIDEDFELDDYQD